MSDGKPTTFSIPDLITATRLLGSPVLIALAFDGQVIWLAWAIVALVFTEWLDGFLARRLHVTSTFGARLDTLADVSFYGSLLLALMILRPALIYRESTWIGGALLSYTCNWLASWIKFGCMPSYHTWAAKAVWVAVAVGLGGLLFFDAPWVFRLATLFVVLANLEAICITLGSSESRVDVPTWWHIRRGPRD